MASLFSRASRRLFVQTPSGGGSLNQFSGQKSVQIRVQGQCQVPGCGARRSLAVHGHVGILLSLVGTLAPSQINFVYGAIGRLLFFSSRLGSVLSSVSGPLYAYSGVSSATYFSILVLLLCQCSPWLLWPSIYPISFPI